MAVSGIGFKSSHFLFYNDDDDGNEGRMSIVGKGGGQITNFKNYYLMWWYLETRFSRRD